MQVYYFTRTHRSEKIAKELADRYNTTANQITDNKDWSGKLNFLKAGAMASRKEKIAINYTQPNDKIILVFPLWAGTFPPAIRTFIEDFDRKNMIIIPTSLGSKLRDREGFFKIIDRVGKEIQAPTEEELM